MNWHYKEYKSAGIDPAYYLRVIAEQTKRFTFEELIEGPDFGYEDLTEAQKKTYDYIKEQSIEDYRISEINEGRIYDLHSKIRGGKYGGKTLREVIEIDVDNVNYLAQNDNKFIIRDDVIAKIKILKPNFVLHDKSKKRMDWKEMRWEEMRREIEGGYKSQDWGCSTFDALTDGQYGDESNFNGNIDRLEDMLGM